MPKFIKIKPSKSTASTPVPSKEPAASTPTPAPAPDPAASAAPVATADSVAVLALGEAGEILAARDACRAVLGWEPQALIGQNIRVVLQRGLDNELGRFLHRHREGKNPTGTSELRVQALRKDGSEFPAQVTTLTWSWDTTVIKRSDTSRLCWTAAFRDLGAQATPSTPVATDARPVSDTASRPAEQDQLSANGAPAPAAEPASTTEVCPEPKRSSDQRAAEPGEVLDPKASVEEAKAPLEQSASKPAPLNDASASTATAKAEADPGLRESALRAQLDAAREAAGYAEAALKEQTALREKLEERLQNLSNSLRLEQAERSKRFEEELCSLRQERDELNNKLTTEQQGAGESTRRAEELEARLGRNAAEVERARQELEKLAAERAQSETSWRQQLDTVHIAKKELEGAWAGAVERNRQFEEDLAKLRHEHDELHQKLAAEQQAATDSNQRAQEVAGRLSRNAAAAERARAELEKENAERERADSEWREQLESAKALKTKLETSLAEATEHNRRCEHELASLRHERDELNRKWATEQQGVVESGRHREELEARLSRNATALEQARTALEMQAAERAQSESSWREQLETAVNARKELEGAWESALESNKQIEQDLAALRREQTQLKDQLAVEKQAAADSKQRAEEAANRLSDLVTTAERTQAALEKEVAERGQTETALREEIEATKASGTRLETALTEANEQAQRQDEELTGLRHERDQLQSRAIAAQEAAGAAERRAGDLQRRVDQNATELERLGAELHEQRAQCDRSEARGREQQEAAKALTRKLETDWAGAMERNVQFEAELVDLRRNRDELSAQLKAEQHTAAEAARRAGDLERRLERSASELKRANGEAERLQAERERTDTGWREQLEATKALARKLDTAWTGATERYRRVEGEAAALRQEREAFQGKLAATQREAAAAKIRTDELEKRVQRMTAGNKGAENKAPDRPVPVVPAIPVESNPRSTEPRPNSLRPPGHTQSYSFDSPTNPG